MAGKFGSFYIEYMLYAKYTRRRTGVPRCLIGAASRATQKVLVFIHDLYCPKFVLGDYSTRTEDLQAVEALETLAGP